MSNDERREFWERIASSEAWREFWLSEDVATLEGKVTKSILKFQREFFEKGAQHLRPLILKDVAEDIEMHESTVSRVTSNKYMSTPRGLFELKYFFSASIPATGGGEAHSAEAVRHRIKVLVDGEATTPPAN